MPEPEECDEYFDPYKHVYKTTRCMHVTAPLDVLRIAGLGSGAQLEFPSVLSGHGRVRSGVRTIEESLSCSHFWISEP